MPEGREEAAAQLLEDIGEGRTDELAQFLLEYLADWGAEGIDAQAVARFIFDRLEAGE